MCCFGASCGSKFLNSLWISFCTELVDTTECWCYNLTSGTGWASLDPLRNTWLCNSMQEQNRILFLPHYLCHAIPVLNTEFEEFFSMITSAFSLFWCGWNMKWLFIKWVCFYFLYFAALGEMQRCPPHLLEMFHAICTWRNRNYVLVTNSSEFNRPTRRLMKRKKRTIGL